MTGRTAGPVVTLAHGYGCDQNPWRLERDATAVLFDPVGSWRPDLPSWRERRHTAIAAFAGAGL
ncbi:hypothetical protein [Streptomyces sp. NBC_00647]|uniref:hypothetical protein n=1 Tax=Streptomyces sp. NBC_00647 TaxID=2975796 RepID=UPI003864E88E